MSSPVGSGKSIHEIFSEFETECLTEDAFSDSGFENRIVEIETRFKKFEASLNRQNGMKESFLSLVVNTDRVAFARFLLEKGADYSLVDRNGNSTFHRVCQLPNPAHFYVFMSHFVATFVDMKIKSIMNEPNVIGQRPLVLALGDTSRIHVLKSAGASLVSLDGEQNNLLHHAASIGAFDKLEAFLATCSLQEMQKLLDSPNSSGKTPRQLIVEKFPDQYQSLSLPDGKKAEDTTFTFSRRGSRTSTPERSASASRASSMSSSSRNGVDELGVDRSKESVALRQASASPGLWLDPKETADSSEKGRTLERNSVGRDVNNAAAFRVRLIYSMQQSSPKHRTLKEQYVLETLLASNADMKAQRDEAKEKADNFKQSFEASEQILQMERDKNEELEAELSSSEQALLDLSTQVEALTAEREQLRIGIDDAEMTTLRVTSQLTLNKEQSTRLRDKIANLRETLDEKQLLVRAAETETVAVLATLEENERTIEALRRDIENFKSKSGGENSPAAANEDSQHFADDLEKIEAEVAAKAEATTQLRLQLQTRQSLAGEANESLHQLRAELNESERHLETAHSEAGRLSAELTESKKCAEAARSQSETLERSLQVKESELSESKRREASLKKELQESQKRVRQETEVLKSQLSEQEATLQQERKLIEELQAKGEASNRALRNMQAEITTLIAERDEKQKESQRAYELSKGLQSQLDEQEEEKTELQRNIREQREQLEGSSKSVKDAQAQSLTVQLRLDENESTVRTLRQDIEGLTAEIGSLRQFPQTSLEQMQRLQTQLEEKENLLASTSSNFAILQQNLTESEKSAREAQARLTKLQTDLSQYERELATKQEESERLSRELDASRTAAHVAQEKSTQLQVTLDSKESELQSSKTQEELLRKQLESSQTHLSTESARIRQLGQELDKKDVTIAEKTDEIRALQTQIRVSQQSASASQSTATTSQSGGRASPRSLTRSPSQLASLATRVQDVSLKLAFQARMMKKVINACKQGDDVFLRTYLDTMEGEPLYIDENGMTLLHHAAGANKKIKVVGVLLEYGSPADIQDTQGRFPADLVQGETDDDKLVRKMLARPMVYSGLYTAIKKRNEDNIEKFTPSLGYLDLSFREPETKNTWLHLVVQFPTKRSIELATLILEREAKLANDKNSSGDTPLHNLCDEEESQLNTTLVGILTAYGADPRVENRNREAFLRTPYAMVQQASPSKILKRASKGHSKGSNTERMLQPPQNPRKEIFDDRRNIPLTVEKLKELSEAEADFQNACHTLCKCDSANAKIYQECCEKYGLLCHWFSPLQTRELPVRQTLAGAKQCQWEVDRFHFASEKMNKEKVWSKLEPQMQQLINIFYSEVLKRAESLDYGYLALSTAALKASRERYAEAVKRAFFESIATNKMHRFLFLLNEEGNGIQIDQLRIQHGEDLLNAFEYAAVQGSDAILQFIVANRPHLVEQSTMGIDALLSKVDEAIKKAESDPQLLTRLEACKQILRAKNRGHDSLRNSGKRNSPLRRILSMPSGTPNPGHAGSSSSNGVHSVANDLVGNLNSPRKPIRAVPTVNTDKNTDKK